MVHSESIESIGTDVLHDMFTTRYRHHCRWPTAIAKRVGVEYMQPFLPMFWHHACQVGESNLGVIIRDLLTFDGKEDVVDIKGSFWLAFFFGLFCLLGLLCWSCRCFHVWRLEVSSQKKCQVAVKRLQEQEMNGWKIWRTLMDHSSMLDKLTERGGQKDEWCKWNRTLLLIILCLIPIYFVLGILGSFEFMRFRRKETVILFTLIPLYI